MTALMRSVDNRKHQCILMLIHSAGLRADEAIDMEPSHISPVRHSVQLIFKRAKAIASITAHVTGHMAFLLHPSFENEKSPATYIQTLLGYSSSKTVEIVPRSFKPWPEINATIVTTQ